MSSASVPAKTFNQKLREIKLALSGAVELTDREREIYAEQLIIAAYQKHYGKKLSKMELYSLGLNLVPTEIESDLRVMTGQCLAGEPVQYVIGTQAFLDHEYRVSRDVLIPRPESESLVSLAIDILKEKPPAFGIELGIGSGIISIELLARFPNLKMLASELTLGAAQIARDNANRILGTQNSEQRLQIRAVKHAQDIWEPFTEVGPVADFFISNPPYLKSENEAQARVVRTEPGEALFAPVDDPTYFYLRIAQRMTEFVKPGGYCFLEVPHERAKEILGIFSQMSGTARLIEDFTGRNRILTFLLSA